MPLGIYISVPFCRTKCSFCNFASDVFSKAVFARYVDRVCGDMAMAERTAAEAGGQFERAVDSVYLGGGTPTVLEAAQLEGIFQAVRSQFDLVDDAEITVECAPGTLSAATIESLQRCGVNRVSLGVQSFVDQEAAAVGRLHKRITVLDDIARLRSAGLSNINLDLIAGLPHQTAASWNFSLQETIASGAPHASIYMLEVDEDSRLGGELLAGGARYHAHFVPDEEAVADFYSHACEQLENAGIAQYEISNFACEGFESQHNLKYWKRQAYLGFGVDAHSMLLMHREGRTFSRAYSGPTNQPGFSSDDDLNALRFATANSLEKYSREASVEPDRITRQAALEESFFLGLRLNKGIDMETLSNMFGDEALAHAHRVLPELIDQGLIRKLGKSVALTARGRLLSNEVFSRFLVEDTAAEVVSPS